MGVDINIYRARIGLFALCCKARQKRPKYGKYNKLTKGEDIHLRTFVCGLYALFGVLAMYSVVWSHTWLINNYAVANANICSWSVSSVYGTMRGDIPSCSSYGEYFGYYSKRLLTLSADIEMNPGPDENTRLILQAIAETKDEVKGVKYQVDCVQRELGSLREEIASIKSKVDCLEYGQEVLANDVASLSLADDLKEERLTNIEIQLNLIEAERLKPSLRIFGLEETESDIKSLKSVIVENVFDVIGKPDMFNESCLINAKRVGEIQDEQPRMVIAKFENSDDKFEIFKFREVLRGRGIRVSNDLSFLQRKQVKEARKKGLLAYFKNGKLVTFKHSANQANAEFDGNTRVFKRARRFGEKNQEGIEEDMETVMTEEEKGNDLQGSKK